LAEDNVINQKVALHLLDRMGYRANVAANGLEVLDALRRSEYDVILMDVQMPEMDGIETTRRIREYWSEQQQPYILAMTAHAMEGDRQWCLASGMDDYVGKPVQIADLVAKLLSVPQKQKRVSRGGEKPRRPLAKLPWEKEQPTENVPEILAFDRSVFEQFIAMMGEEAQSLLELFLNDIVDNLQVMRRAFLRGDSHMLAHVAHTLKSSSAQLGALRLSSLCQEIESLARQGGVDGADYLIQHIEQAAKQIEDEIRRTFPAAP
jgi:CheY-like chemotaxis protein